MQPQELSPPTTGPTWLPIRLHGADPWVVGPAAVVILALVGGLIGSWFEPDNHLFLFGVLAAGLLGLVCAVRGNALAAVISIVLAAVEVRDPAPPATWVVAGGLLLLFSLRRPRLDAVTAGTALALAGVLVDSSWSNGGLDGGAFGICMLAAAMVGIGQWVQAQRKYVVAETGRRREESERRRVQVEQHVTEERLRIARDLHDSVAHHIAVVSVQTNLARASLSVSPEAADRALQTVQTAARDVLSELQDVLGVLRDKPSISSAEPRQELEPDATSHSIDELTSRYAAIGLAVDTSGTHLVAGLPQATRAALYRILQEALTNAHRYGDGHATVQVDSADGALSIVVRNHVTVLATGRSRTGGGHGLIGMNERVKILGGTLSAGQEDHDFVVRVRLPVDRPL